MTHITANENAELHLNVKEMIVDHRIHRRPRRLPLPSPRYATASKLAQCTHVRPHPQIYTQLTA